MSVVKVHELLSRQGCVVPYRTLHRFAVERCDFRVKDTTVRVVDGEPGVELQIDFGHLGYLTGEDGRRRKVHALIFTACYSRHLFVWVTYSQTLAAVIAGCEAAWAFFGGVVKVLIRSAGGDCERRLPVRDRLRRRLASSRERLRLGRRRRNRGAPALGTISAAGAPGRTPTSPGWRQCRPTWVR